MISFKDMMKYKPPNIEVFRKFGKGYLREAAFAVDWAESALVHSRLELAKNPDWGNVPVEIPEEDLISMYAYWTQADDLLKRLDRMSLEEREQQLALDANPKHGRTFEDVSKKHANIDGRITAWEEAEGKESVYPALDRQMKRRLDTWERGLVNAERYNFENTGEPFETIGDFCSERTIIEYAAMGIYLLQARERDRLRPLPYLDTFIRRRLDLDVQFRRILKGRYQYAPWAELPQFWWHHPPQEEKEEKRRGRK